LGGRVVLVSRIGLELRLDHVTRVSCRYSRKGDVRFGIPCSEGHIHTGMPEAERNVPTTGVTRPNARPDAKPSRASCEAEPVPAMAP
jgi:hypothetical protein